MQVPQLGLKIMFDVSSIQQGVSTVSNALVKVDLVSHISNLVRGVVLGLS